MGAWPLGPLAPWPMAKEVVLVIKSSFLLFFLIHSYTKKMDFFLYIFYSTFQSFELLGQF